MSSPPPPPRRYAWPASARPIHVLLVDDDDASRVLMAILLRRASAFVRITEAKTALDGVAQAREHEPDVIVLDVQMPGMSGPEAIPLFRQASEDSKIILFSDQVEHLSPDEAASIGADLLVRKGPDFALLVPAIMQVRQVGFGSKEAARRRLASLGANQNPA